jgi:16S rRNA G1207 methylase RsmC
METKNFLEWKGSNTYELIVMNPPFHLKKSSTGYKKDYWDIDFVMKAYKYLSPNGELLAITSAYLSHGKKTYKKWIKKLEDEGKLTLLKEYKNYKWSPTLEKDEKSDKKTKLLLNFNMYKLTK